MKEIPVSLEGLKKEDVFAVATALLYSLKNSPKYKLVSELFYVLDYDNFIKLIKYFGGQEIRIPTTKEISQVLKDLLVYQYWIVEEMPLDQVYEKVGLTTEYEQVASRNRALRLVEYLKNNRVEGLSEYE